MSRSLQSIIDKIQESCDAYDWLRVRLPNVHDEEGADVLDKIKQEQRKLNALNIEVTINHYDEEILFAIDNFKLIIELICF